MKKLSILIILFIFQLHQQSISASSISAMQPMNIETTHQPSQSRTQNDYQRINLQNNNSKESPRITTHQNKEQELTCFQKCFTTHKGPYCCNSRNETVQYSSGYCGTCCETSIMCIALSPALLFYSPLIIAVCIISPCIPTTTEQ